MNRVHAVYSTILAAAVCIAAPAQAQSHGSQHSTGSHATGTHHAADSSFKHLQERGKHAMGFDQYKSKHAFDITANGGRIEVLRMAEGADAAADVAQIRAHLLQVAEMFSKGDFSTPAFVHMKDVPGTDVMAAKKSAISYQFRPLANGGEIVIATSDPAALKAVHEFMKFQRSDHRTDGKGHHDGGH